MRRRREGSERGRERGRSEGEGEGRGWSKDVAVVEEKRRVGRDGGGV